MISLNIYLKNTLLKCSNFVSYFCYKLGYVKSVYTYIGTLNL